MLVLAAFHMYLHTLPKHDVVLAARAGLTPLPKRVKRNQERRRKLISWTISAGEWPTPCTWKRLRRRDRTSSWDKSAWRQTGADDHIQSCNILRSKRCQREDERNWIADATLSRYYSCSCEYIATMTAIAIDDSLPGRYFSHKVAGTVRVSNAQRSMWGQVFPPRETNTCRRRSHFTSGASPKLELRALQGRVEFSSSTADGDCHYHDCRFDAACKVDKRQQFFLHVLPTSNFRHRC